MTWLGTDLSMLATDAEQLRRHLHWLLEDLRVHSAAHAGCAATADVLADELAGYLDHCARFEALPRKVPQAAAIEAGAVVG